jgi:hypothetical protein
MCLLGTPEWRWLCKNVCMCLVFVCKKSLVSLLINHRKEGEAAIQMLPLCYLPYSRMVVNIPITGSKRCDRENSSQASFLEPTIVSLGYTFQNVQVSYFAVLE